MDHQVKLLERDLECVFPDENFTCNTKIHYSTTNGWYVGTIHDQNPDGKFVLKDKDGVIKKARWPKSCVRLPVHSGLSKKQITDISSKTLTKSVKDSCSICLETMEKGNECRELRCKHMFHCGSLTCDGIDKWLGDNRECPLCREAAA